MLKRLMRVSMITEGMATLDVIRDWTDEEPEADIDEYLQIEVGAAEALEVGQEFIMTLEPNTQTKLRGA